FCEHARSDLASALALDSPRNRKHALRSRQLQPRPRYNRVEVAMGRVPCPAKTADVASLLRIFAFVKRAAREDGQRRCSVGATRPNENLALKGESTTGLCHR